MFRRYAIICLLQLFCIYATAQTVRRLDAKRARAHDGAEAAPSLDTTDSHITFSIRTHSSIDLTDDSSAGEKLRKEQRHNEVDSGYTITRGFDNAGKSITKFIPERSTDEKRSRHLSEVASVVLHDGDIQMLDGDGVKIAQPPLADKIRERLKEQTASVDNVSPFSSVIIKDIADAASKLKANISYTDASHAELTKSLIDPGSVTMRLSYERRGNRWFLMKRENEVSTNGRQVKSTSTITVRTFGENSEKDKARRGRYQHIPKSHPQQPMQPDVFTAELSSHSNDRPGKPRLLQTQSGLYRSNVVYVHGFNSNSGTWDRMRPWLSSDFTFSQDLAPSIGSGGLDALTQWSIDLDNYLSPQGSNYLAVGHSAGGLVSRALAVYDPSMLRAVITVDTPHDGSILLSNGYYGAEQLINYGMGQIVNGACWLWDGSACDIAAGPLGFVVNAGLSSFVEFNYAAANDLTHHSVYTQGLNAAPAVYPHGYVATLSDSRWLEFRLVADAVSYPDDTLGGQNVAYLAEITYDTLWALDWLYWSMGWDAYNVDVQDGDGDFSDADWYFWMSSMAQSAHNAMDWLDDNFYEYCNHDFQTGEWDSGGDGLVGITSQIYPDPNAPGIIIYGGDSHIGATKSWYVRSALDQLISLQMFAKQAAPGCSYDVNLPSTTVPANGGHYRLKLQTAPNCQWAATTTEPWLTLDGVANGSGSAELSIDLTPNTGAAERQAFVNIGSLQLTFTQSPPNAGALSALNRERGE